MRLSAATWSMLEALSRLRKSVQKEIDFLHSISPQLAPSQLEGALLEIDAFSAEISDFLSDTLHEREAAVLESNFEALNQQYQSLSEKIESILGR